MRRRRYVLRGLTALLAIMAVVATPATTAWGASASVVDGGGGGSTVSSESATAGSITSPGAASGVQVTVPSPAQPAAGPAASPGPAASGSARSASKGVGGSAALAEVVRQALVSSGFGGVVDFGPVEGACPSGKRCPKAAPVIDSLPNVDAAVIEINPQGRPARAAEVLLSRDYPAGRSVAVDANLNAAGVHWLRWDIARADGIVPWNGLRAPADDLVPGGGQASTTFMSPYPASTFALLAAFATMRLVDAGAIDLDAPYRYVQAPGSTCLGETFTETKTTRTLLDRMMTHSETRATCMVIKQLHELGQIEPMNAGLRDLGLRTLQLEGTDPGSGGRWTPGDISMTALDTARLLLLVDGAPGVLWRGAHARPVMAEVLKPSSRELLQSLLGEQGFNEVLSTSNWCGRDYPVQGIPQVVASRWVDAATGTVTVDQVPYGQDVRPCNARAEVTFAHKTGLTYNYGSDAGIVRALPGHGDRHYVIAVFSNLGSRYSDPRNAMVPAPPCSVDVCFTEAFARLGKAIDSALAAP